MKLHLVIASLGGMLAVACAPTYSLTIHTNPQGALLVEHGTGSQFLSPAVLTYELTEQQRKSDGCFHVQPVEARGASGAAAVSSNRIELCGNYTSWTITIERPDGAPGLEQDLATAAVREREVRLAQINQEIRHLESQARMAAASEEGGYTIGCAIAGGCPTNRVGGLGAGWADFSSPSPSPYPSMAPDGSFVTGQPTLCPDGTFVGSGGCSLAPDGSYVGGRPQLAPNGTYVGGPPKIGPDGTYVGGSRCVMAPDGSYVGARELAVYSSAVLATQASRRIRTLGEDRSEKPTRHAFRMMSCRSEQVG